MTRILETGCLMVGILCLLYYFCIVIYAGLPTSLAWIWPLGGAFLMMLRFALRFQETHAGTWMRFVTGVSFVLLAAAIAVLLAIGSRVVAAMRQGSSAQSVLEYVIVLGAQVRGTKPSRALKKRLERTAEYAVENPDTVFILSGGQGSDEDISEAECMYQYLVRAGVDEERLIKEGRSTSTEENLRFAAELIRNRSDGAADGKADVIVGAADDNSGIRVPVGVLSNSFHIYRALILAQQLGYTDVSGIAAPSAPLMMPHNIVREVCAILVMKLRLY